MNYRKYSGAFIKEFRFLGCKLYIFPKDKQGCFTLKIFGDSEDGCADVDIYFSGDEKEQLARELQNIARFVRNL